MSSDNVRRPFSLRSKYSNGHSSRRCLHSDLIQWDLGDMSLVPPRSVRGRIRSRTVPERVVAEPIRGDEWATVTNFLPGRYGSVPVSVDSGSDQLLGPFVVATSRVGLDILYLSGYRLEVFKIFTKGSKRFNVDFPPRIQFTPHINYESILEYD